MNLYLFAVLGAFVFSGAICAFLIPKILLVSYKRKLFDFVNERKQHKGIVPRLGGVAFVPSIIISGALVYGFGTLLMGQITVRGFSTPKVALTLCALFILYLEGIADDLVELGYKAKFGCQFLSASLVVCSGIFINNFYGLFGIEAIPLYIGIPFSIGLLMFIINALNLIDGIDGLASGLSIVSLFVLGFLFFYIERYAYAILAFSALGTLIPFFCYNVFGDVERHHKIFMGDCGSQVIGLVLGLLAIRLSMDFGVKDIVHLPNSLLVAFSVLLVPCFDALRVMCNRMMKGKNPFFADATHIHHKCLAIGMSHRTAMLFILMVHSFFIMLNLALMSFADVHLILLLDIALWIALHRWLNFLRRSKTKQEEAKKHDVQLSIDTYSDDSDNE